MISLECNAYVSANFYAVNSARICDRVNNTCICSATTEKCTGEAICNTEGTCQGKYDKYSKYQPSPEKWKTCSVLLVFHISNILPSNIKFVINPIFFFLIYHEILLITLRQQSNPQQIINVAPGKLLLDFCISAVPSSKNIYQELMATRSTTLSLFITFQEYQFQGHVLVHMAKITI